MGPPQHCSVSLLRPPDDDGADEGQRPEPDGYAPVPDEPATTPATPAAISAHQAILIMTGLV